MASRIASRCRPRRGRAATIVRSTDAGRQPAAATRSTDLGQELSAGDAPVGSGCPPGRGDRDRPGRRPRAARRRARGGRRRHRNGRRGAGRLDHDPAQREGLARPERVAVMPDPDARRGRPGEHRFDPAQVGGLGHLEVARVSGNDMDRDSTGLQEGGFVGPCLRAVGRIELVGTGQETGTDALRGLGRHQVGAVDGLGDQLVRHPLDGLGDGHDRDRRPVQLDSPRDRFDQGRGDQRAGAIVDEDDPVGGRRRPGRSQRVHTGRHGGLPPVAADDDPGHALREPRRAADLGDVARRGDDHHPLDDGRRGQCLEGPGEHRPAADRRPASCRSRPSAAMPRRRRR